MIRKLKSWGEDYIHLASLYGKTVWYRTPPEDYLGYIVQTKVPVVLLPGVNTTWQFMKIIADEVSRVGHPIYILKDLGYNRKEIRESADIARALIDKENLQNVIILAHSKGGLIGKELLINSNADSVITKVITIATPFCGSRIAKVVPDAAMKELRPDSKVILNHNINSDVNKDIISIYGTFDNHIWPTESCHLEGAENIQVPVDGHHKILSYPGAREVVIEKIASITSVHEK
jgi:hypothetical protein